MRTPALAILGVALLAADPVGTSSQEVNAKPLTVTLKKITPRKGQYRPGFDVGVQLPAAAWSAAVGKQGLVFFDLNGDSAIEPEKDGMALVEYPFVVPIPDGLLLAWGQFEVSFEGTTKVIFSPQSLGDARRYVPDASLFTELRIRSGLRPAALDAKACADCEKHCDYLEKNGMAGGEGGISAHGETKGRPGYCEEGEAAGRSSDIGFQHSDLKSALLGWYATAWHGAPMVDPQLRRFGVALKHGVAMLYFFESQGEAGRDVLHPADGAIGVPRTFGPRGEMPNPVPGTQYARDCGFPILVRLVDKPGELVSATVTDAAGRSVKGSFSCPVKPATSEWPSNSGCAVFIPRQPLAPNSIYRVSFGFREGKEIRWSFTTGR
ncbi:MAG: hypothetical protein HYY16_00785 [Planctomycetes bacterium]|nr:hypothetical protein [Planctomycetota bacterium]